MSEPRKPAVGVVRKIEYAAHRGCSAAYVSKLIKTGKLAPPALMANGRINIILADQMLGPPGGAEADSLAPPVAAFADPDAPVYAVERARREKAQAALAELQLQERQGRLLHADAVRGAAVAVFQRATARIADGFADLAIELAQMTDAGRIADRLSDHLRRNMAEVNREFLEDAARRSAA
jgi:hypothetical protein